MPPPSVRLSCHYAALFGVVGTTLPYWSLWLHDRGLEPVAIGLITGATVWGKLLVNPLAGLAADALGRPRWVMAVLALGSLTLYAGISWVEGVVGLLLMSLGAAGLCAALMPLSETLTLAQARAGTLDYGRVRLWGSLAFIVVSFALGPVLDRVGSEPVPWIILGFLALVLVGLPSLPSGPRHPRPAPGVWRHHLLAPRFLLFLLASGLIQAGHATYYTFATLHWRAAGLDGAFIGFLWAEGVAAEVALFFLGRRMVARLGPLGLLGLGAGAGVLRWTLSAFSTEPMVLMGAQVLHAGTFACAHLGAMHFLSQTVPPALANRAQALYSTLCQGVLMGAAMSMAGPVYQAWGGRAFLLDAGWCALGGLCVAGVAWGQRRGR
ncbi:MFS transporter [Pararhodospirillum photometricum]|uniref:Major facilitator superfamily MFS_1 n=1 Tax=Pararhodospirillum photometricum DSM 122 TaxID=1150469 RepID=H6SIR2_PARPM|nr:MFS transporter [Pararhodospirillum photometricum]CCG06689.1 Major facilitator superfamily MFS_1 [Pararhodospirillum photometricum DSM 122]